MTGVQTCALPIFDNNLAIGFGFQDNAAFILEVPQAVVDKMIEEALNAGL